MSNTALSLPTRRRVLRALAEWSGGGSIVGLRTQALVLLALDSALRVSECCALELGQILESSSGSAVRIVERGYLRASQAKGGRRGGRRRDAGGPFPISRRARAALRRYVLELRRLGWVPWPPPARAPLFLGHRLRGGAAGHARLSKRAAQWSWHQVQARARLPRRYGFHALRHDALTRCRAAGGDVFDIAELGRLRDIRHADRYVHREDAGRRLGELAERSARL